MIENLQINTVNVQSPTPSKGTSGAEKVTWTTTVNNMPCRVIDASATWKVLYSQRKLDVTHQVFTSQSPTVKVGYQLIFGTKTLRVIGVLSLKGPGILQIDTQELQQ